MGDQTKNNRFPEVILNKGDEDQLASLIIAWICLADFKLLNLQVVRGFRKSIFKTFLTWIAIVVTVGVLRLVFYWMKHWMVYFTHSRCDLKNADYVLLQDVYKQKFVCKVRIFDTTRVKYQDKAAAVADVTIFPGENGTFVLCNTVRYFEDRRMRYLWNDSTESFQKLLGLDQKLSVDYFQGCQPLARAETLRRLLLFRPNEIDIRLTPILTILVKEVLNPFYIFQLFSISLWCSYGYYYYAGAIAITTTGSLALTVHETRKTEKMLRDRVQGSEEVTVCRPDGKKEVVTSDQLVPGDVFIIPAQGGEVVCDAVLIAGNAIVNESALTGESVPVTKTSIPQQTGAFDIKAYQRHMLFAGTKVLQTRYYGSESVKAIVIRTGFTTSKGALIRSIMFPKPVDFQFYRHTYYFVLVLAGVACCGMIYSAILRAQREQDTSEIIIRSLDVITIAVPPALPAALSVGIVYAQRRLKKCRIFCLSPRAINVCGSINVVCFDKTGTLTQDGLDLRCVVPCRDAKFTDDIDDPRSLPDDYLKMCLVSCHSLTIIQNKLAGDPVDLIMFQSMGWQLVEPNVSEESNFDLIFPTIVSGPSSSNSDAQISVGIIRDFPFSSNLQRMSTIVKLDTEVDFCYFVKGAPETLITLCLPETVPIDFLNHLDSYTRRGYRLLAIAYKVLKNYRFHRLHKLLRDDLDFDLIFLGFIVMENRLKADSKDVITELHNANVRTVMITGDNMHTAISVARECGMVQEWDDIQIISSKDGTVSWTHADPLLNFSSQSGIVKVPVVHLAVSGESFSKFRTQNADALKKILAQGTVFARMSPTEKELLVEDFQKQGYYVAMCGDGANDCGALKAAHTGISLSESEAAAAAPFTACTGSINCVPTVIKEGRAALVTSFGIFKYMAGYSLTQFFSVILLYSIATNFSDLQFLYSDIAQVLVLSATFGRSKASERLARTPPPTSLIAFIPLFSVFSQVIIVFGLQLAAFFVAFSNKDSTSYENLYSNGKGSPPFYSKENFAVFSVSAFQYVWLAIAFSKGPPYRKMLYKNKLFCLFALTMISFDLFLLLGPTEPVCWLLELLVPESWSDRFVLLSLVIFNAILAILFEKVIVEYLLFYKLGRKYPWLRNTKTHEVITKQLVTQLNHKWWNDLENRDQTFVSSTTLVLSAQAAKNPVKVLDCSYSNQAFVEDVLIKLRTGTPMDHLSKHNFIHCDLANCSILFTDDNTVKIADFGLAHQTATRLLTRNLHPVAIMLDCSPTPGINNHQCRLYLPEFRPSLAIIECELNRLGEKDGNYVALNFPDNVAGQNYDSSLTSDQEHFSDSTMTF